MKRGLPELLLCSQTGLRDEIKSRDFFVMSKKSANINPKVLSFALRKGGVCRTTLVFNISYAIATQGYRVLMIDLDSQHNLTNICVDLPEDASTIYDALADGQEIGSAIFPTTHERLFLLPGDSEMSTLDFALAEVPPEHRFQILFPASQEIHHLRAQREGVLVRGIARFANRECPT